MPKLSPETARAPELKTLMYYSFLDFFQELLREAFRGTGNRTLKGDT